MVSPRRVNAATLLEAVVAVVLFGCIPVIVRYVDANPYTIGTFRLAVATIGLTLILAFRRKLARVSRGDVWKIALIGAFFFAHWLTYFISIKMSSASIGAIGLSTYGVQLLLLSALFGDSRLTPTDVIGVILAVIGAVLVVPQLSLTSDLTVGMLLACVSAFFYAALPLLHQRFESIPSSTRALGQFGVALLLFLLFFPKTDWSLRPVDWAGLTFLAVGSTLIGHTLWVRVTTRFPSGATSVIYYANLPVALGLSVLVLGEPLRPRMLAGAALIVGGSILGLVNHLRRS